MNYSGSTSVSVRFHGVRGSIPCAARAMARYGGNTSCVEIRSGHQLLILDAGTGIRNLGKDLTAEFGARAIDASLLISHTHWDHIQGLPFFGPAYSAQNRVCILAAQGKGSLLAQALKEQMKPTHFPVGFERLTGVSEIAELGSNQTHLGNFLVSVVGLNHPGGCAGFRIESNGKSIGYFPDHEPYIGGSTEAKSRQTALIDFVRNMDLLIMDTQFSEREFQKHTGWGHGCLPESVALALKGNVRQLALFHHDPSHNDDEIDAMVQAAQELAHGTQLTVFGASESKTIALKLASALPPESATPNVLATA